MRKHEPRRPTLPAAPLTSPPSEQAGSPSSSSGGTPPAVPQGPTQATTNLRHTSGGGCSAPARPLGPPPDFTVSRHGDIFLLRPHTTAARRWLLDHVEVEGWEWLGPAVAIDHHCIQPIIHDILQTSLTLGNPNAPN
jgi:hypothetical protein